MTFFVSIIYHSENIPNTYELERLKQFWDMYCELIYLKIGYQMWSNFSIDCFTFKTYSIEKKHWKEKRK